MADNLIGFQLVSILPHQIYKHRQLGSNVVRFSLNQNFWLTGIIISLCSDIIFSYVFNRSEWLWSKLQGTNRYLHRSIKSCGDGCKNLSTHPPLLSTTEIKRTNKKTNKPKKQTLTYFFSWQVILDLHWSNKGSLSNSAGQQVMADTYSIQFWTQVANAYKYDPAIIFELYNEPHVCIYCPHRDMCACVRA